LSNVMLGRLAVILAPATSVPGIPRSRWRPPGTRVTSSWECAPIEHPTATALVEVSLRGIGPRGGGGEPFSLRENRIVPFEERKASRFELE
jgi:hypothetical protein